MKKLAILLLSLLVVFAAVGCNDDGKKQEIILTFGGDSAYFTGTTSLYPIAGETPVAGESFESATVILKSDTATKMALSIDYAEGIEDIEGLMIRVDGTAQAMKDDLVLYESTVEETEKQLSVEIYLKHDAPTTVRGKTLEFYFVLSGGDEK